MAIIIFADVINGKEKYIAIQEVPKAGSDYIAECLRYNKISFMQTNIPGVANPACSGMQYFVMGTDSSHCIPYGHSVYNLTEGKNRLCFVRHPLSWLRSWWKYKDEFIRGDTNHKSLGRSWRPQSPWDRAVCTRDFGEFIDIIIEHYPGIVGAFFSTYLKESGVWGKTENLYTALYSFIASQIGIAIHELKEKTNTGGHKQVYYTKDQADKIMRAEEWLVKTCDYDYIPEGTVR